MKSKAIGALALGFTACAALAQTTAAPAAGNRWGGYVDMEAKPGSKRSVGETELFIPLMQDGRSMVFGNARARFDGSSDREGNLGLGYRRMLDEGWNAGGYGFIDRRRTGSGNTFGQVTLGGEALGADFDFRGNVYLPTGSRTRRMGTATSAGGGITTAAVNAGVLQMTTTGLTSTVLEERSLRGYDAEVGWRLPLFALEDARQLRLFLGGYHFSDGITRVSGPRIRAEYEFAPIGGSWGGARFIVGAETQHDGVRGQSSFFSVRLRLPFDGPAGSASDSMGWQARRMTTPVRRDVDIVTAAHQQTTQVSQTITENAATIDGSAFTVLDSSQVSGANLPAAVAAAGANSTVLLSGTFSATPSVTMQPGQKLLGGGAMTVQSASGRSATVSLPMATLQIGTSAGAVVLTNDSVLRGLHLTGNAMGGDISAVGVVNGTNAVVENNVIDVRTSGTGGAVGIIVAGPVATNVRLRNNVVTAVHEGPVVGGQAIGIGAIQGAIVLATGNTIDAQGPMSAYAIVRDLNATFAAGSTGNVRLNGGCDMQTAGGSPVGFTNAPDCN